MENEHLLAARPAPHVLFPNRIREVRRTRGLHQLQALAAAIREIPYIRLSRIERGESMARANELRAIAAALGLPPAELLLDPADPNFDLAAWAAPFASISPPDDGTTERRATLLGAALRHRRHKSLTVAALHQKYALPPVTLARIEAGQRPIEAWNPATRSSLLRLFEVADEAALDRLIEAQWCAGLLTTQVAAMRDEHKRLTKMALQIGVLREQVGGASAISPPAARDRWLAVSGAPRAGGLIAPVPVSGLRVEAPLGAGPRTFALRVCAPTLGFGLPAHAVVIADPDVPPLAGGLAVLRVADTYRLLALAFGRGGAVRGLGLEPPLDVPLSGLDPADLSAVVGVAFP